MKPDFNQVDSVERGEVREWVFSLPVSYNWALIASDVKGNQGSPAG